MASQRTKKFDLSAPSTSDLLPAVFIGNGSRHDDTRQWRTERICFISCLEGFDNPSALKIRVDSVRQLSNGTAAFAGRCLFEDQDHSSMKIPTWWSRVAQSIDARLKTGEWSPGFYVHGKIFRRGGELFIDSRPMASMQSWPNGGARLRAHSTDITPLDMLSAFHRGECLPFGFETGEMKIWAPEEMGERTGAYAQDIIDARDRKALLVEKGKFRINIRLSEVKRFNDDGENFQFAGEAQALITDGNMGAIPVVGEIVEKDRRESTIMFLDEIPSGWSRSSQRGWWNDQLC